MSLISQKEISQIATDKIIAGGSMFGSAALLLNHGQIANIAQQIAEAINDSELAENKMLSECILMETAISELKENQVQKELDELESEKRRMAQQ